MTKYQEFQEKMTDVPTICGYDSKDVVALKYKQLLEEVLVELEKTNQPCHNLVSKILKNNPQVVDELFQLLSDFKFNSSETRSEKVEEGIREKE